MDNSDSAPCCTSSSRRARREGRICLTTSASAWPRPAWPTAGGRHLAVVAEDGAVYTCGSGEYGRQGLGDEQPRRRLTRVPQAVFMGSRVVKVSCGGWHTMAVTVAGHAWTCGDNLHGQLGVGDTANRLGFTQVDAGQLGGARIVMAAC